MNMTAGEFWGFWSSVADNCILVGFDVMSGGNRIPLLWGNIVPSFSVADWSWKAFCDAVPYLRITESPRLLVLTLLLDHSEEYLSSCWMEASWLCNVNWVLLYTVFYRNVPTSSHTEATVLSWTDAFEYIMNRQGTCSLIMSRPWTYPWWV
jgi:hypothetical protein